MGTTNLDSLELSGNLTVTGAQIVTGGEVLSGSQVIGLGMSVGSNAAITGALTVGGTSSLTGAVTMVAGASIGSNAVITGTASITGAVTMVAGASIGSNAVITGTASITSNASIGGTLAVTGITSMSNDLEVSDTSTGFLRVQTSNTQAAGVIMAMQTPASNTGDLILRFTQGGSATWAVGCDTSDTAAFILTQGSSVGGGSTDFLKVSLAGAVQIGGNTGTQVHTINTASGTTVGSAGTAAAIPTPVLYIPILLGTVSYKIALLNP